MGARKRPGEAEVRERLRAWADDWNAVAGSTEPADRRRAEAAIGALYELSGRRRPEFRWVDSPVAGLVSYAIASREREGIVNPYAVGDVGTGANRLLYGLGDPFGQPPDWMARLVLKVVERLPADRRHHESPRGMVLRPEVEAADGLGIGGTLRMGEVVRSIVAADPDFGFAPRDDEASLAAAATLLGDGWGRLVGAVGEPLARSVLAGAIGSAMHRLAEASHDHRRGRQAMQVAQWDVRTPTLLAAREVFGAFLWRLRSGRRKLVRGLELRAEIARSAFAWWALDGLAIVAERPLVIRRDDRGRLHCADGPALAWGDGTVQYSWHGVAVTRDVIEAPESITVERIRSEENAEVRRVLIERFGEERLVREGGATLVHEDETGRLWHWAHGTSDPWGRRDEPVVMVEVRNSTLEPDGSRRTYYLRVPPSIRTAHEAVAWTFGLEGEAYRPAVET